MKSVLSFFTLGLLSISSMISSASATTFDSATFTRSSDFFEFNVENDENLNKLDIVGGKVEVNEVTKVASLILQTRADCPPSAICIAAFIPHIIALPLIKTTVDGCGIITYKAEIDKMPVDGEKQTLIIKDNSRSTCKIFYHALTQVSYKTKYHNRMQGKLVRNSASFLGDLLQ